MFCTAKSKTRVSFLYTNKCVEQIPSCVCVCVCSASFAPPVLACVFALPFA
eukprot:m.165264 g.165264  ORF g.165264 m.165264 type:complete len:51 (-) comp14426_c0_seq1:2899-3051(-)